MNIFLNQGDVHHFQYPSIVIAKNQKGKKPIAAIDGSTTQEEILHLIWKNAFPKANISIPKTPINFYSKAAADTEKEINFLLVLDFYKLSRKTKDDTPGKRFIELASFYEPMISSTKPISNREIDKICDEVEKLYIEEKSTIAASKHSKVFKDCSTKASAFQAGIRALVRATEEPSLLVFNKAGNLNSVCILEKDMAVIKRIGSEARAEEQRLIEELFFIRNLEGIVPQYSIKELSRRRFGIIPFRDTVALSTLPPLEQEGIVKKTLLPSVKSSYTSLPKTATIPLKLKGASVYNRSDLKLESAIAVEVTRTNEGDSVSPVISRKHRVTAQPFKNEMVLYRQLKASGYLHNVLSKLTTESQYSILSLLEMQPLDLHHDNIGFQPSKRHLSEELRENYDTARVYVAGNSYTLIEYILHSLRNSSKKSPSVFISLTEDKEPKVNTFDFTTLPWEIVLFDTDCFFFESSSLMKINYNKLHQVPLRFVVLETEWAQQPLSKRLLDKLKNSEEIDKTLQFLSPKQPALKAAIRKKSKFSFKDPILHQIENLMRLPKYSISEKRLEDPSYTMNKLKVQFENDLASAACEATKNIWAAMSTQLPSFDCSLTSDTKEALKIRSELIKGIFPKISARMIDEYKKRCERRYDYLSDYEKLQKCSALSIDEQKAFLAEILEKESTPLLCSTRLHFIEMLKKPKLIASLIQKCLSVLQPSFFTIAVSMYPILGDVWELLPENYMETDAGKIISHGDAVGNYMICLEEIVARYLLDEFLPNQHLISDPRVLSLTLQFKRGYSISHLKELDALLNEQGLGYGSCHFACKRVVSVLIKAYNEPKTVSSFVL